MTIKKIAKGKKKDKRNDICNKKKLQSTGIVYFKELFDAQKKESPDSVL